MSQYFESVPIYGKSMQKKAKKLAAAIVPPEVFCGLFYESVLIDLDNAFRNIMKTRARSVGYKTHCSRSRNMLPETGRENTCVVRNDSFDFQHARLHASDTKFQSFVLNSSYIQFYVPPRARSFPRFQLTRFTALSSADNTQRAPASAAS